jgi:hypothetical protein
MIILHVGLWESSLLVLSEVPTGETSPGVNGRQPTAEVSPTDPLPNGAGRGALLEALRKAGYESTPVQHSLQIC